jgi:hypothetical protein
MVLGDLEEVNAHVIWWLGAYSIASISVFEEALPTGSNPELIESTVFHILNLYSKIKLSARA